MLVLERSQWLPRAEAHEARVAAWTEPHLARRRRGEKHPVHDFLFDYYSYRPAALRRWHPGAGVVLLDAPEYVGLKGYDAVPVPGVPGPAGGVVRDVRPVGAVVRDVQPDEPGETPAERHGLSVGPDVVASRRDLVEQVRALLVATAGRTPMTGCFGLHEWAMVHRAGEHGTRHDVPLRLGADGTDRVVESHRIACTHFDAFRFFTPTARPLNTLQPDRDDRVAFEQPGCLHAGMDLYKHAFRLSPMVPAELVADCFALALEIRVLDMRASPYDLSGLGHQPVRIETAAGKQEYAATQRGFAERGAPLRRRLIEECERLQGAVPMHH